MKTLARESTTHGEVVLQERVGQWGERVVELRVNGTFVMDSAHTATERRLAEEVLRRVHGPERVLVGGLGLGFTLQAVLADPRVRHALVVEIEPVVARWVAAGRTPGVGDVLADPRVALRLDDVRRVIRGRPPGSLDAVLLDVDNGPGALVVAENAELYSDAFLAECSSRLTPGGALAVWSAAPAPALLRSLRAAGLRCQRVPIRVRLQERLSTYFVYVGQRS